MKTSLFFLAIIFSFAFSKVNAQCPSGDVEFLSQEDVNNFVAAYPNCTHITGKLSIGEYYSGFNHINNISILKNLTTIDGNLIVHLTDLVNLTGLQNVDYIGGDLVIIQNSHLTSIEQLSRLTQIHGTLEIANENLTTLNGLENITKVGSRLRIVHNQKLENLEFLDNIVSVGGFLQIARNDVLESLEGLNSLNTVDQWVYIGNNDELTSIEALQNLISVDGKVIIEGNIKLTSLDGIQNINPTSFGGKDKGLEINLNQSLSTCNLPNICEYLSFDPNENPRSIVANTGNCTNVQAVLAACGLGVNDVENEMANWQVHYKKENNTFLVQSKGFQISDIQVYNLNGQLVKEFIGLNSNQEEISIFSPDNILIIKVITTEGKSFGKKVVVK